MRLFVALELPEPVKAALDRLVCGVPGARWLPQENLHLTLRFVGEAGGHGMNDLLDTLSHVASMPFELSIEGVGHFETGRRPHALWAGVARSPALAQLQSRIETAVRRAGFPPEKRRFVPHVTLARLDGTPAPEVSRFISAHSLFRAPPFTVTGFVLFASFLSKSGAIHRPEAEFDFLGEGFAEWDEPAENR